jgi:membrane-associated phospholipid phosphatase
MWLPQTDLEQKALRARFVPPLCRGMRGTEAVAGALVRANYYDDAMALLTIEPTKLDQGIARAIARHARPPLEKSAEVLTLAADEHVLLAVVGGLVMTSLFGSAGQRRAGAYLAANAAISALVPHLLKRLVNQRRPDRDVRRVGRGIPRSGKPYDAFPSGHAVHIGAIAAALTRLDRRLGPTAWSIGGVIASTRVLLLAHWASDVLAGLALGVLIERGVWSMSRGLGSLTKYRP